MMKLVAIRALLAAVALIPSVNPTQATPPKADDSASKLEEIRALLAENNRLQRMDVHKRLYSAHPLMERCDFSRQCQDFDLHGTMHAAEALTNRYRHTFRGECGSKEECKKAEESLLEAMKKYGK